jgi:DNA adenine methylase
MFSEIKRAWAVWLTSSQSFSSQLDSSWGYDKSSNTTTKKINSKKEGFVEEMAIRLQNCQIECADALYIIASRETVDSFFTVIHPTIILIADTMMAIPNRILKHFFFYWQE